MLESLPVIIIVGTVLGFLSGLGIGGGSLLIIWLTTVLHKDPMISRSINLMFFLPGALIACWVRSRKGRLDVKTALPGMLTGCVFALVGWWISTKLDTQVLKKLFGTILLFTGTKELLYRPRNAR